MPLRPGGWFLSLLVFCGLLASACATSRADPQSSGGRITLRLQEVTLAEVAAAITAACGVRIDPSAVLSTRTGERASFAWDNASLDRVLRELCGRFRCGCGAGLAGEYRLYPAVAGPRSPIRFTGEGVTVFLTGVARNESQRQQLVGGVRRQDAGQQDVSVSLLVDLGEERADLLARIEGLIAVDDLGNRLLERFPWGEMGKTYPSQRFGLYQLPLADGRARTLASVEGTLVLFRRGFGGPPLELPYPGPGASARHSKGEEWLQVSRSRPAAPVPAELFARDHPDLPATLLAHRAFEAEEGPSLVMEARQADDPVNPEASQTFRTPRAIGRSGASYPGRSGGGGSRSADGWTELFTTVSFPGAEEPLEKLVWDFRAREQVVLRLPIRLTNLPLPALDALPVQQELRMVPPSYPPLPLPSTPPAPFFRPGGATLRSEVRLLSSAAPAGRLRVGLAAPSGPAAPVRWSEVPVTAAGAALLEGIAPGRYRVLRQYVMAYDSNAPLERQSMSPAGRWLNSEVVVEVPPAGSIPLPPLVLTDAPPDRPAPAPAPTVPALRQDIPAPGQKWIATLVSQAAGRAVGWENTSVLRFRERGQVSLSLSSVPAPAVEPPDPGSVHFISQATAMDDLGTVLTAEVEPPAFSGISQRGMTRNVILSAAHPQAKRLRWLEGELYAYRRRRRVRLEAPFPPPGESALVREGSNVVAVVANDTAPSSAAAPPAAAAEASIRFRLCYRNMVMHSVTAGGELAPVAVGRSGAEYSPRLGGGMGTQAEGWVLHARKASYPAAREPLQKLIWEFEAWEGAEPAGHFRIDNVPLPLANRASPARRVPTPPSADKNSGTLSVPLAAAPGASLPSRVLVGLSFRGAAGWGGMRWTEVAVVDGRLTLSRLRPGRYRLVVQSRTNPRATTSPVEVTLVAGRSTSVARIALSAR